MSEAKPQLEGGDIMMISKNHVLIGSSERTNERGIARIKQKLQMQSHDIEYLSVAYLPASRYCMHWDTVFTFTDRNEAVAYQPLLNDKDTVPVKTIALKEDKELRFKSFHEFTAHFLPELTLIPCGDGIYPFDQREQWTDGCNFFALKPGVRVCYDYDIGSLCKERLPNNRSQYFVKIWKTYKRFRKNNHHTQEQ